MNPTVYGLNPMSGDNIFDETGRLGMFHVLVFEYQPNFACHNFN